MNLVCFRHPQYDGKNTPVLSCKTCCTLFLAALKNKQVDLSTIKKLDQQYAVDKAHNARIARNQKP